MAAKKSHVLVVDDEPTIRMFLRANLAAHGYEVSLAQDGAQAVELASQLLPDVIVLDLNLPGMDGVEVCRRIREWSDVPIIVLSVREAQQDKVKALDEGADDYVTKPFGIDELLARIRVALRRAAGADEARPVFTAGELKVDLAKRVVTVGEREIRLTRTEYGLLAYLVSNQGKILTHADLLRNVWGPEYRDEREYLRVFVGQLRKKIEPDPSRPTYILTVPRIGYRFVSPNSQATS